MSIWVTALELECVGLPEFPSSGRRIRDTLDRLSDGDLSLKRKRSGSRSFEYNLDCLPLAARAAILKQRGVIEANGQQFSIPKNEPKYSRELLWQSYEKSSDTQKQRAQKQCGIVSTIYDLVTSGVEVVTAIRTAAQTFECAVSSASRWYYRAVKFERCDWLAALVSRHSQSTTRRPRSYITPAAWDFFTADYLRPEKPALAMCFARLTEAAKQHDWTVPSESTLQRKIEREIPQEQRIALRDGEHALLRLYPAQERTVLELEALEWINGDGYQHNVFVRWFNGEVLRPKTWIWQDIRTRKILGYRCDVSENSDSIRLSLSDVITKYGIPRHVTIDNTRAAANKWLTGGVPNRYRFKVKPDDPKGLIPLLGIQIHWTSINFGRGHGQAKPVERAFSHGGLGDTVDKHPLLAGAYTGANTVSKPDNYGSKTIDAETFLRALEDGIVFWNRQRGRQSEVCRGELSFDEAFEESYKNATVRKATAEQRRLLLLPSEAVTVRPDGTFTLDAGGSIQSRKNRYFNENLIGIKPNKIVIRFDPQNLHQNVLVYTLDGRFVCEANCLDKIGFGDTQAAREHKRQRTNYVKRTKEAAVAQKRMTALEVAALMSVITEPEPPETKIVELFQPAGNTVRKLQIEESVDTDAAFNRAVSELYNQKMREKI